MSDNEIESNELLACPFCGGNGKLIQGYYSSDPENNYAIQCKDCSTIEGGARELNEGVEYNHPTPSIAAETWNRRPDDNLKFDPKPF